MIRTFAFRARLFVALLAALAGFAACADQPTQKRATPPSVPNTDFTVTSPTCDVDEINRLVRLLTRVTDDDDDPRFDLRRAVRVPLKLARRQLAIAQSLALRVAGTLGLPAVQDLLSGTPAEKQVRIAQLINLLFSCVQLPTSSTLPTAFGPGGVVTVIGAAGGDAITRDAHAGIRIPAGALTSDHLITIAPRTDIPAGQQCLSGLPPTTGVVQLGRCYEYTITPPDPFVGPSRTNVVVGLCSTGFEGPVHDGLRVAKQHGTDAPIIFDYFLPPFVLNCLNPLGSVNPGLGDRLFGSAWQKVTHSVALVTRPFRPSIAFAADGVGSHLCDPIDITCALSNFITVSPKLTVTPATATLSLGDSLKFIATLPPRMVGVSLPPFVEGAVVWSVNGFAGGNATYGTVTGVGKYKTPAAIPVPASVQVCARFISAGMSRPPLDGCASVTITSPPPPPAPR